MCGRFTLTSPAQALEELFETEVEPFPPRYNIAPTQPILIVIGAERRAMLARWGLIPAFAKDPSSLPLMFNARSETAAEKASFRAAMRYRRCLVPADGFYEWRKLGKGRSQPFFVRPADGRPLAFAGLMETFLAPDGSEIDTAAILTTGANETLRPIHERMPVVIGRADFPRWLDCREVGPAGVASLLRPAEEAFFEAVPVSAAINKVANMGPEVQAPAVEKGERAQEIAPAAQGTLPF
ncbi:SOS response-associated peptidase [Aureimonas populi]|uniref:Abasic site processing protein n=1 Tax=Aureimonas populi TaxID=1701758 RepID=A0ABW5CKH9_9HYPH|nr:SOS response-associated peptidase [Aureimonas populi]